MTPDPAYPMHTRLSIWCILLLHIHAAAQQATYSFRTIDINQGLSQNSVIDIANDGKGFLWFATQDGLNRYDGKGFAIFRKNFDDITTPAYSRLGKIIPGINHDLWLITSGGRLERFNLYNDSSTPYKALSSGTILPPVSCFRQDEKGALWIGTERDGLFYHDTATRKTIHYTKRNGPLNSDSIQFIFQSRNKQSWVLTNNGITVITPGQSKTTRFLYRTTAPFISCSVLEEDATGNLWVGTYAKGLYVKSPRDTAFRPFTGFNSLQALPANLVIQAIRTDEEGCLWVGTLSNGLYIINMKDATVRQFKSDDDKPGSLSYNDVLCIQPDKLGGMWVGTDGGGVSLYDKRLNIFSLLSKKALPKNIPIEQVRAITIDPEGGIWIGTSYSGLSYATDIGNHKLTRVNLLAAARRADSSERIVSLHADANDTWVGTQDNGLLIIDRQTKSIKTAFIPQGKGKSWLPDHTVWCMQAAGSNRAWLGTRNAGLCLLDKQQGLIKNFRHNPADPNSIADNNVRAITPISDSVLCLGFENEGIQFYNINTEDFSILPTEIILQHVKRQSYILKCIYFQSPLLWIGTLGEGMIIYDIVSARSYTINENKGLPNNTIYSIVPDRQGALWMSTNKGITRFMPPADLEQTNRTHFSLFTVEDGLQGNEFNTGAYYADTDGTLYFGGTNGLNWFDPAKFNDLVKNPYPPVVITQATINNESWKGDTSITYKKILKLAWHQNSLSFNFAALDFVAPGKFSYYYQLYPYDKNWIDAGNRSYAAYTNIPPGEYTFRVRALGQTVSKDDPLATLSIIITPPFWKTWWFIGLCVLALGTFLYLLYQYRINQLIAMQKVRNRIATDLHDDIGSTLTNINILSELSRQKLKQQEEAELFLNRISEEVHNSSQALDDIVWSINTNNDTLEQTVARMRRYAAEIFDGANIHYTLQLDEHFAKRKLNMEQRRDCFLLFKEAINNIYKHAAARNVSIRVWLEHNQLRMTIEDDGKGFDITQTTHRNGLKNMRQRVQKWNGSIKIQSTPGNGTCTTISFLIQ
ncbi:hypothetical protein HB364_18990 [Pseudoflavitalea sp. X16]|uniref:sensor histidine kinase n=1 Tax=Paraflavitalea devenefica TaxID=2716334 RepID=UPI00141FAE66|nr:sensor histidine kinase [Paraflavitalea devenefica]NII27182.1 hypothetical protein [Paraflavitalea devenefica]